MQNVYKVKWWDGGSHYIVAESFEAALAKARAMNRSTDIKYIRERCFLTEPKDPAP